RFNPAENADLPKQAKKEVQAFSPDQANKFLRAAEKDERGVLLTFALITGMRPEEYFGLQWKDVDLRAGTVMVRRALIWRTKGGGWYFAETKTSHGRRLIPIPASMLKQLKRHKRSQAEARMKLGAAFQNLDLVFTTADGGPLSIQNFTLRHFKPTLTRAKLSETFKLYSLRHTCATLLLSAGENPKVVSERLGHSSVRITLDTYCHVLPHMQQGASDKLEKMLFKKVGTL
ncbi:MAG: site-specific integrase, partial [Acidobacteriota bacterium]